MSPTGLKDMRRIFAEWPASIPRTGLVVTKFGESIPFANYMLFSAVLVLVSFAKCGPAAEDRVKMHEKSKRVSDSIAHIIDSALVIKP